MQRFRSILLYKSTFSFRFKSGKIQREQGSVNRTNVYLHTLHPRIIGSDKKNLVRFLARVRLIRSTWLFYPLAALIIHRRSKSSKHYNLSFPLFTLTSSEADLYLTRPLLDGCLSPTRNSILASGWSHTWQPSPVSLTARNRRIVKSSFYHW